MKEKYIIYRNIIRTARMDTTKHLVEMGEYLDISLRKSKESMYLKISQKYPKKKVVEFICII